MMPAMNAFSGPLSYESVVQQTPAYNTTVYVGNLTPYTTQADLVPIFQAFGYIIEVRMQSDRGFAFVKLDSHENAAMAIVQLQGTLIQGRPIKCSWGKDRSANAVAQQNAAVAAATGASLDPNTFNGGYGAGLPMYNMPQAQPYGQFGYPSTNPAAAAAAAAAAAGVGMPGLDPNQWSQYFAAQQAAAAAQFGQQQPQPHPSSATPTNVNVNAAAASPYAAYAMPSQGPTTDQLQQ